MRSSRWILPLALLGACQGEPSTSWQPALAPKLTTAQLSQVRQIVGSAVGSEPVHLSPDLFRTSPILTLSQAVGNTPQGRIATGRMLDAPAKFQLVTDGSACAIEQPSTARRWTLTGFDCEPYLDASAER